jgi:geranylgeranyl diphosphate synthase type I
MSSLAQTLVDREDLREQVDTRLSTVLAEQRAVLADISSDAAPLVEAWAQMLRGGKRLRAAFAYWSWRAHGGARGEGSTAGIVGVGAALELFQAAALFHDDVMDRSDTRRGVPTAHRTFAARHRDAGWSGDADQFGLSAAILLGDLSLVASEDEFLRAVSEVPAAAVAPARVLFTRMRTEVTVGQYLDMHAQMLPWTDDFDADERRAREVVRSKSARYSVESPIAIGAALAGAAPEQLATCSAFGLPLGEAFQLRDDLLGAFGDPETTGKPAGDDLREGKRTLLVIRAMRALDPAARTELASMLGAPDLTAADVAQMQQTIRGTGAADEVEELIETLSDTALSTLAASGLSGPAVETLSDLARAAVQRAA